MKINNIVIDIDGTITDGKINYCSCGSEFKSFNVKDGIAINTLLKSGVNFYAITGRKSEVNIKRLSELGIENIYENISDKVALLKELEIDLNSTLYVGDDINDIDAMKLCGLSACPQDASTDVKNVVNYVSKAKAGDASFREIIENFFDVYDLYKKIRGVRQ